MQQASRVAILLATFLTVSIGDASQAQRRSRRPEGVTSLGEMNCRGNKGGAYQAILNEVNIGYERFTAVAKLGNGYLYLDKPQRVVCKLAQRGKINEFNRLGLVFGISDENRFSKNSVVKFLLYLDGELLKSQDVTAGRKYVWDIDVQGVNSIALELQCLKAARTWDAKNRCPDILFFEDILEK